MKCPAFLKETNFFSTVIVGSLCIVSEVHFGTPGLFFPLLYCFDISRFSFSTNVNVLITLCLILLLFYPVPFP